MTATLAVVTINQQRRTDRALQRLAKWRVLLTGWQLGTREKGDPEGDAVGDHREATLMLRVQVSALTGLLIDKGTFSLDEFLGAMESEADLLNADLERRFPGVTATEDGLTISQAATAWMKNWRP
jgi:hypothetical protein